MITRRLFDSYRGRDVYVFTIENDFLAVEVCDFGGAIRALRLKKHNGLDVCLGFGSVGEYLASDSYCGATVGRVANRVAGAEFALNGHRYALDANDGANCNHSGAGGFDRKFFDGEANGDRLTLSLVSPDGDGGFPGRLELRVVFELDGCALTVKYEATSDADTFFAPTCHAYFNLAGEGSGNVGDTLLSIAADRFTPLRSDHIPTGELRSVDGTPFDFRKEKALGRDIDAENEQLSGAGGYDHNFIINAHPCAIARSPRSGVGLELDTDLPGLQLYSANFLNGCRGKSGIYNARDAFCLEPQFFPNAVNTPAFPSPLLRAGLSRTNFITYKFFVG